MKRIINSVAPIRVCDLGGWTDTWFAKHGAVLNLGVYPYVQCQMTVQPSGNDGSKLTINAENYGVRYTIDLQDVVLGRHPLLSHFSELSRLRSLSVRDLLRLQQKTRDNIWRVNSELRKGTKPHLDVKRRQKLQQYELKLQEINRLLGDD